MEKKIQERYINKATKILSEVRRFVTHSGIELPKELKFFEGIPIDYIPSPFEVADAYGIYYKFIKLTGNEPSYYNNNRKTIFISDKYRNNSYRAKFLCAHELGHIFMQSSEEMAAMNNDELNRYLPDEIFKEYEANIFALLLMPQFMAGLPWENYMPKRLNRKIYEKVFKSDE